MTPLAESLLKCRVEGNILYLPPIEDGPLPNYPEVKTALLKAGAKYKRNTFVFENEAQPYIDKLLNGDAVNIQKEFQFFATPQAIAELMVDKIAVIGEDMKILEPSAGDGALIKALCFDHDNLKIDCFELMDLNRKKLSQITNANILGEDFLKCDLKNTYDIIIANPPFTKNQDIDHIRKMFEVCKPGGTIITLASPSWTFGSQKKQVEFKTWLEKLNAEKIELDEDCFKSSGTAVVPVMLVIKKPVAAEKYFSADELRGFRIILEKKLDGAETELIYLKGVRVRRGKGIKEEGYEEMDPVEVDELIGRQDVYIQKLNDALQRIKDKKYGICEVTGELIDKQRLLAIPHTTLSHAGKLQLYASSTDVDQDKSPKQLHDEQYHKSQGPDESSVVQDVPFESQCRVCGCTEDNCAQCIEKTGSPCYWVVEDGANSLCSACALKPEEKTITTITQLNSQTDMDFFKQLVAAVPTGLDATIRITEKEGKLTVGIFPAARAKFPPINMAGTAEEIDNDFFNSIAKVKDTPGYLNNADEVKKKIDEKAEKKSESKPAVKKSVKKSPAKKAVAKKTEKKKPATPKPSAKPKAKPKPKVESEKKVKPEKKAVVEKPAVEEKPRVEEPALFE